MKLQPYYNEIKNLIFEGLKRNNKTLEELGVYFKEVQKNQVNGDFNRACVWVGSQLSRLWLKRLCELYKQDINDNHVNTLYRKFFKELGY